jgi:ATP-dependent RNA helicase DDX21
MAPTRELAKQVGKEFEDLKSELKVYCIYGGMPYDPQGTTISR